MAAQLVVAQEGLGSMKLVSVGWAGWSGFNSGQGKDFSFLPCIWTGSGDHPASYPVGTGDVFSGGKVAGA
jgi:hypothetical protein